MDREKILSKIQKCFNLSKSSNAGEAANALRQAQKMIELHGVSLGELDSFGYGSERVSVPIQVNKKLPALLSSLVSLIKRAFGVAVVIESEIRISDRSYVARYFGPNDRVLLAGYAHEVVFKAMNNAWDKYLEDNPEYRGLRGARSGFILGWLETVRETVNEFAISDSERKGIEGARIQQYGEHQILKLKTNSMKVDGTTLGAGITAGESFKLHRPVGRENLKISA